MPVPILFLVFTRLNEMRKMTVILLFLILFLPAKAPEAKCLYILKAESITPVEILWNAVCIVESGRNHWAYYMEADGFPSVGIAQIREIRLKDFNRRTGKSYQLSDMWSPDKSKEVFLFYCKGKSDLEYISRCWNGGENGMRYKGTLKYWQSIKMYLN
jgi:hypothetical protein